MRRWTVVKNLMQLTPVHASVPTMAPNSAAQGTAMSSSGQAVVYTRAFIGLDVTDANPGSPPREAPV
jgi:hypothetical protein